MKSKHRWNTLITVILCTALLAGCKGGLAIGADAKETKGFSLPQAMIIVATERNRYQQLYTEALWNVSLSDGTTFQTFMLDQVQVFLKNLKTMTLLAKEQSITLTSAEKDQIRRLSASYYEKLTPEDIAYMNIKPDDVTIMYQEYYLANKVVHELTKDLNLEVSDSEARVMIIQQIEVSSEDTANEIYKQVTAEGSDFAAIAKEQSINPQVERYLGRGEEASAFEDASFDLTIGQISPIVSSNGSYYIIKCISDYEEKATAERKTQIHEERKRQVFQKIYSQFQADHDIVFSEDILDGIVFSSDDKTTSTNFFQLYQEEFGG